jgi:predicted ABC-type transport system involved in lysophospholipase L1 biosynthesis ATPase subunit
MPDAATPLVILTGIEKDYRSLRPLRVRHLELREAETVALLGFDQASAEVLVNLIAGATLPDAGQVRAFGRLTSDITNAESWLKALDQFGIISERAVLLEEMTTAQNLAVPLTLELHDVPPALRTQVAQLAAEVGLGADSLDQPVTSLQALDRMRLRLGRALAVAPRVLMAEHPNASLATDDIPTFAADLARVAAARRLALLLMTADRVFAASVADHVLELNPATGELSRVAKGWRRWFG